MRKRLILLVFCSILAPFCKSMQIVVYLSNYSYQMAYIPQDTNDMLFIEALRPNYIVHQVFFMSESGYQIIGYIFMPSDGSTAFVNICDLPLTTFSGATGGGIATAAAHHTASQLQMPAKTMLFLGSDPVWAPVPVAPVAPVAPGNSESNTVCIDSLTGNCQHQHCNYRHLTDNQKVAVSWQRQGSKARQCTICTNKIDHDHSSCLYLHLPDR